ncbi:hypothetical protein GUITHDRAFT_122951 [Guillardia theta CCMP2712]|uniref:Uncharacterized protein n=1 Tax=Guillardia theta (strain CCMP2712) TaxID=905079 RepID=L1I4S6_GUITC|nr:hypothetical protein GUITHDRAFT_122951 [Guillardia theta CCMP2712]EKX30835.1 hypothetical protein GUITHDRAFT_122951 [Guillardia theta CCMP2712]|eukprot:XP_005817815.1 hypothetical protein GUITHDRAFT_122951 [Guillardia theta CCMP2712]
MHVTMSQSLASMREKGQTVEHIAADMGVALDDIGLCTFVLKFVAPAFRFQAGSSGTSSSHCRMQSN